MTNTGVLSKKDNIKLAVSAILISALVLSMGDAVIKSLSVGFSLWQIYIVRSCLALPVLVVMVKLGRGSLSLVPDSIGWTALRSALLVLMWLIYYAALPHIKLSVAAAVYYTIPLFVTVFSALFTGDKVAARSWFAVVIGFVGVVVVVKPDAQGVNGYALLPMLAAILYALAMILTRTKLRSEDPRVLSLSLNVSFILVGFIGLLTLVLWSPYQTQVAENRFLLGTWTALDVRGWVAMAILSAVVILGSLFAAIAYQNGPPPLVATCDYAYLVFSALFGFVFFSELLDAFTMIGMVLITVAGLLSIWR